MATAGSSGRAVGTTGDALLALWASVSDVVSDPLSRIPGSSIVWRYIKASHRNDPLRTLMEIALVIFIVRTYTQSRTKGEASGRNFVKLSEKVRAHTLAAAVCGRDDSAHTDHGFDEQEIDELVDEWAPEPLVSSKKPPQHAIHTAPVVLGPSGPKLRAVMPPQSQPQGEWYQPAILEGGKMLTNLASPNFGGFAGDERIKDKAIECLRRYGVGSCGPPGFYGTFDVHMELERDIARFLGLPACIIYAHSFSTIASVIPSFSKRGDIIVADKGVNFAIQKGILISRSTVRWYDHGDYDDLERILEGISKDDKRYGRKPTASRRFIITEGVFENDGTIVDLPRVVELKKKYKYRLMLDETWSFGAVGHSGRGVTELFDMPSTDVDILTGSMAVGLAAGGGFCAGSEEVTFHQRINSPAFVFSASLPPLLAVSASEAIQSLSKPLNQGGHPLAHLQDNVAALRGVLDSVQSIEIPSDDDSPVVHVFAKTGGTAGSVIDGASRDHVEGLLQRVVDECFDNGVLVTRTKRNLEQELFGSEPSLRICVTAALSRKEVEKAANVLKSALIKVLGKGRK